MHAGKWEKKSLQGTELRGKTLGIVGLGRIGMEVARRARAFGMEIVAHDPFVSAAWPRSKGYAWPAGRSVRGRGLPHAACGAYAADRGHDQRRFDSEDEKGVRLVNCARGELVNEAALGAGREAGPGGRRGAGCFCEEPLKNSPLTALENIILTPHIGGSTYEAQEAVGYQIALQVKEYLKHGVIQNAVNVPSVSHDEYVEMQPYIVLAERLGSFLAQVSEERWKKSRCATADTWRNGKPT